MFHKFYNRVIILGTLIAKTALYIGSGQDSYMPSGVQGALLKDAFSQPYIPGSSIKGVLRSFLESIQDTRNSGCFMGGACTSKYSDAKGRTELSNEISMIVRKHNEKYNDELILQYVAETIAAKSCPACSLFGSSQIAGKVKIADAVLVDQTTVLKPDIRNGVAIERDTRTAKGSALYDMEAIPAGTRFQLKIIIDNLTQEDAIIFGNLLEFFALGGIFLGGRIRSGLGSVYSDGISVIITAVDENSIFPKQRESVEVDKNKIATTLPALLKNIYALPPIDRRKINV